MLKKRLSFDEEQNERRTRGEIHLAERRANADISLAERKLVHERAMAQWKRKIDLAEEVLVEFYEFREIIKRCRNPSSFRDEGSTRVRADWETDEDARTLNSYFVPSKD